MTDPKEFAKLIALPKSHPDRIAMNYIVNSLVSTKMDQAVKEMAE
jgi:hypothetical protein